jgi:hypothetical protein
MVEVVVKIPEKLKERMSKLSWIDWASVAKKAISERLEDIEELEIRRKVVEISEIPEDDDREVKESVCEAVVKSEKRFNKSSVVTKPPSTISKISEGV